MQQKPTLSKRKAKRLIKNQDNIETISLPNVKKTPKRRVEFYLFILAMLILNGFTFSYWLTDIFDDLIHTPISQAKKSPQLNKKVTKELPPKNASVDTGYNASSGNFPPGAIPAGVNLPGISSYNSTIQPRTIEQGYGIDDGVRQKFTGYERDKEIDLDFAQSRYYNPKHGRFISPDQPFADQDVNNPQSWNLYSYVRNNPLNLTDPLGMAAGCPPGWEGCIERDGKYYWDFGEGEGEIEILPGMVQDDSGDSGVPRDGGGPNLTVGEARQQQAERRNQFVWNNIFAGVGHGIGRLFGRIGNLFGGKSPAPTTTATTTTTTATSLQQFSKSTLEKAVETTLKQKGNHIFRNKIHPKPHINQLAQQAGGEGKFIGNVLQNINGQLPASGQFTVNTVVNGVNLEVRGFVQNGIPIINSVF